VFSKHVLGAFSLLFTSACFNFKCIFTCYTSILRFYVICFIPGGRSMHRQSSCPPSQFSTPVVPMQRCHNSFGCLIKVCVYWRLFLYFKPVAKIILIACNTLTNNCKGISENVKQELNCPSPDRETHFGKARLLHSTGQKKLAILKNKML